MGRIISWSLGSSVALLENKAVNIFAQSLFLYPVLTHQVELSFLKV